METKGLIYSLVLKQNPSEILYVGKTRKTLEKRLKSHWFHRNAKMHRNKLVCTKMRKHDFNDWLIEPILLVTCTDKALNAYEKRWIRKLKPPLNKDRNGSLSEKRCEYKRRYDARPWVCHECNFHTTLGSKGNHLKSKRHLDFCLD